jgi:acetolactate synthase I/II/III large subunit
MGFGPAAALGVAARGPAAGIALVGDGAFGSNPSVVATAVEMGVAVIWVVMNNAAFGTIAGLQRKHYGTGYGCEFEVGGEPYSPDFAAVARACGADGFRIEEAGGGLRGVLEEAMRHGPPHSDRRTDAEHAGDDARRVGHRAHLPGRAVSARKRHV